MHRGGELNFRAFRRLFEALQSLAIFAQVDAVFAFELIRQPVDNALVKIITAEEGVAGGGFYLEDTFSDFQNGNIKGAATEVIDSDGFVLVFFVQPVSKGGCGWFVNDAQHFKTGNLSGIFGCIALSIVEISRHGDDSLGNRLAKVCFGVALNFAQNHGGNFRCSVVFAAHQNAQVAIGRLVNLIRHVGFGTLDFGVISPATHETFDREDRVFRVDDCLVAGDAPNEAFTVLVDCHNGWHQAFPFG